MAVSACGTNFKLQPALGETLVVVLSDGGFNSPHLHQNMVDITNGVTVAGANTPAIFGKGITFRIINTVSDGYTCVVTCQVGDQTPVT